MRSGRILRTAPTSFGVPVQALRETVTECVALSDTMFALAQEPKV